MGTGEADMGKRGRQGQVRPMGASKAGGGRRDQWGQVRLVGAGEANGHLKALGQIPSQHGLQSVESGSERLHASHWDGSLAPSVAFQPVARMFAAFVCLPLGLRHGHCL